MEKTRIMVVEDEIIVALDLQSRLELLGYEVVATVRSGQEAIQTAGEKRPDLVLMDINLEGEMDGIKAATEIRKLYQIPIVYLTAWGDSKTLERAKEAEPFGYMIKPFEDQELRSQIEIAIYKNREEKRLRASEERYSLATQGADDGLWDWDLVDDRIYFSPRWESLLGYASGQLDHDPQSWLNRIHPQDRSRFKKEFMQHLNGDSPNFQSEHRIQHFDGSYRWMLIRGRGIRAEDGRVTRIAGSLTDITERKLHDPLTGLPNRALFMERLEQALQRCNEYPDQSFSVLALKVDNFRKVTESLGYRVGDELLSLFVRRLQSCVGSSHTVVSLGEDGFAVLLESTDSVGSATRTAGRFHREMGSPFQIEGQDFYVNIHVGIALGSVHSKGPEEVLRDAQTAVARAVDVGNGDYQVFEPGMRSRAVAQLELETRLRKAIERDEFRVDYQPIVALADGRLAGFEALVRWQSCERTVLPDHFLPTAEQTGLLVRLERWVLAQACQQLHRWSTLSPHSGIGLSVNFSADQWCRPDMIDMLKETLVDTGIQPHLLKLEITESTFLRDTDSLLELLSKVKELGVQLHMDDFGTGYSSLSYLHRFPLDLLKIDRSFVADLENPETQQIIRAITTLGKTLNMGITAEGVEKLVHLRSLQVLECDYGQGYLFSKAVQADRAARMVVEEPDWASIFEQVKFLNRDSEQEASASGE